MADRYENTMTGMNDSGVRHVAITPANTDLAYRPRGLLVTVTGNVEIRDELGVDIVYPSVPAYTLLQFRAMQVRTGTTATVVGWD